MLSFWNIYDFPHILAIGTMPDGNMDLGCGSMCCLRVPHLFVLYAKDFFISKKRNLFFKSLM